MKHTIRPALLLALTAVAAPSSVHSADEKNPLAGAWSVVKAESNGTSTDELLKAKFTFKDDKLTIKLADDKARDMTVKFDEAKTPKQIDLTYTDGGTSRTAQGVYEVDGDKLKMCIADPDVKERPTEFKSKSRKVTCVELTRDKK